MPAETYPNRPPGVPFLLHGHSAFILGIQLLVLLILTIVVLYDRLGSETRQVTLIGFGASDLCFIQNGTFQRVALHLHQMKVRIAAAP